MHKTPEKGAKKREKGAKYPGCRRSPRRERSCPRVDGGGRWRGQGGKKGGSAAQFTVTAQSQPQHGHSTSHRTVTATVTVKATVTVTAQLQHGQWHGSRRKIRGTDSAISAGFRHILVSLKQRSLPTLLPHALRFSCGNRAIRLPRGHRPQAVSLSQIIYYVLSSLSLPLPPRRALSLHLFLARHPPRRTSPPETCRASKRTRRSRRV